MTASLPARLQDGTIGIENTALLPQRRVLGKVVAGHILTNRLSAQLQLAGNLKNGFAIGLEPLDISIPGVAPGAACLLPNLVVRSSTPIPVGRLQGWRGMVVLIR